MRKSDYQFANLRQPLLLSLLQAGSDVRGGRQYISGELWWTELINLEVRSSYATNLASTHSLSSMLSRGPPVHQRDTMRGLDLEV
jgi:hypothetical protein